MAKEDKPKKDPNKDQLVLKLNADDSALVVRVNGEIELISRELQGKDDNYVGDLEDLNKTFTLVLAFAASLENEQLYHHLFQNLNHILHKQWTKLPKDEKERIKDIRMHHLLNPEEDDKDKNIPETMKQEWLNRWKDEIERGRAQLEEYMNQHPDDRQVDGPFSEEPPRRKKKKKVNPLTKLKNVKWNPYDETLTANMRSDWRLDTPPTDEED